jgi:hypothetical protein
MPLPAPYRSSSCIGGKGRTRRSHQQGGREKTPKGHLALFRDQIRFSDHSCRYTGLYRSAYGRSYFDTFDDLEAIVIRKVLKEAQRRGLLKSLPLFPTISRKDNPRSYFSIEEYKVLRDAAKQLGSAQIKVRGVPLTEELFDFIVFATNVFVRPSDLKLLRHKDVRVIKEKDTKKQKGAKYLLITPPKPKTAKRESATMEAAMHVYERVRARHQKLGLASDDDYVFFPELKNREYALATMRRQFEFALKEAGLKHDKQGKPRTLYSLRHTALMFRLL